MGIEELESEILRLEPGARARLAEKLLQSLETLSDAENEALWLEEAKRRHEHWSTGEAYSADAVLDEARARLK